MTNREMETDMDTRYALWGSLAAAGVVLAVVVVLIYVQNAGEDELRIGVLYPLSGPVSFWGEPAKNGATLAAEEINARGGVDGRMIRLVIEDSRCEPMTGVTAANKLMNIDKVRYIIGDICSPVVMPVAPEAQKNGVLMLAQGSSPDITGAGDSIFRNWPSDAYQGSVIARYAYETLGVRRVLVINRNDAYGNGLGGAFRDRFLELGGTIVLEERFEPNSEDFRTILLKAEEAGVDAIYTVSGEKDAPIAKQARELGLDATIIGADSIATPELLELAQGALDGVVYAFPYMNESDDRVADMRRRYEERFGGSPDLLLVAAHGYDAVMILASALEDVAYDDVGSVKENLYATAGYPGLSGMTTFDENGDVSKPYGIYRVVNDTGVLLTVE